MKPVWLSLMAATLAFAPMTVAHAESGKMLLAQADDDDDDDDDAAPAAGEAAAPAEAAKASPMAPAEKPGKGMPASALNAKQLGLPDVSKSSQDIPEMILGSAEKPFVTNHKHFVLRAGQGYRWKITSAGDLEYKFHASDFFRNVWFNQIVISDLELHMAGPPAWLEYDAKGTIAIQFTTIRPGDYEWHIEGLDGAQDMQGTITVIP